MNLLSLPLHHHARQGMRHRLQRQRLRLRLSARCLPAMRRRLGALPARLARQGLMQQPQSLRSTPERFKPIDRVMRRCALSWAGGSFSPRLSVQAMMRTHIDRHAHRAGGLNADAGQKVHERTLVQRERLVLAQRVLHEHLLERLVKSSARVATQHVHMMTRVERRAMFPRVQSILVRAQSAPPAVTRPQNEEPVLSQPATRSKAFGPRPPATGAALTLPPQELSRLTDHVIRQLDHRVLSFQERSGRI